MKLSHNQILPAIILASIVLLLALCACCNSVDSPVNEAAIASSKLASALSNQLSDNKNMIASTDSAHISNTSTNPVPMNKSECPDPVAAEKLCSVMLDKAQFYDTDAQGSKLLSEYLEEMDIDDASEGITWVISQFAILDIDADGVPELLYTLNPEASPIPCSGYGQYVVVLHYANSNVYSYRLGYKSLMDLHADGMFSFSSGISNSGLGRLRFTNVSSSNIPKLDFIGITYCDVDYGAVDGSGENYTYFVDQNRVTEDEYMATINALTNSDIVYAPWFEFSDDNVKTVFSSFSES